MLRYGQQSRLRCEFDRTSLALYRTLLLCLQDRMVRALCLSTRPHCTRVTRLQRITIYRPPMGMRGEISVEQTLMHNKHTLCSATTYAATVTAPRRHSIAVAERSTSIDRQSITRFVLLYCGQRSVSRGIIRICTRSI